MIWSYWRLFFVILISSALRAYSEAAGCVAELRTYSENGEPFVTDNKNYIIDLYFKKDIGDLNTASDSILRLPSVVEHGMFPGMATTVIVAVNSGSR